MPAKTFTCNISYFRDWFFHDTNALCFTVIWLNIRINGWFKFKATHFLSPIHKWLCCLKAMHCFANTLVVRKIINNAIAHIFTLIHVLTLTQNDRIKLRLKNWPSTIAYFIICSLFDLVDCKLVLTSTDRPIEQMSKCIFPRMQLHSG